MTINITSKGAMFLKYDIFPKNGKPRISPFSKIDGKRDFLRFPKKAENGEFPDFRKKRKTGLLKGVFPPPFKDARVFNANLNEVVWTTTN